MLQNKWKTEHHRANMQDKTLARHPMKDCSGHLDSGGGTEAEYGSATKRKESHITYRHSSLHEVTNTNKNVGHKNTRERLITS